MNKTILQSIISRYHLGGLIESTKWVVENDILTIKFMSPSQDMLGELKVLNFKIKNAEFAVFDTTKLNKLISITDGDLYLDFTSSKKILNKLLLNDKTFNLEFPLADTLVIPKVAVIKDPGYNICCNLLTDIPFLIKAQNALDVNDKIYFSLADDFSGNKIVEVYLGEDTSYSNRILYKIHEILEVKNISTTFSLLFDSILFKEILNCNKDATEAKMYISVEGLIKLQFKKDDIESTYFLVKKEDI